MLNETFLRLAKRALLCSFALLWLAAWGFSQPHFLRFTGALLAPDLAGIDSTVTPDARFHELEAIGYPLGPEGFKG